MKPGFMSSVCPKQTLGQLIQTAQEHGYLGIEFRTEWEHAHGVELGTNATERDAIRRELIDNGIAPTCIATSVRFNSDDAAEREEHREQLRRYIVLAAEVGAPYIRTFGDPVPSEDASRLRQTLHREAESYALIDDWAKAHHVEVLIETHGNLRADHAQTILRRARGESLGVLWHIGHHIRHDQSVDEAYPCIQRQVRHLHFSAMSDDLDAQNQRSFELLAADGFSGFFSVEVINPDDPETVLQHHMTKFNTFLQAAEAS